MSVASIRSSGATLVLPALLTATALGAALRFSTLGVQSYHHDEIITIARVLPGSFVHMLRRVKESESNPPLYYVVAWLWAKVFGTGEFGLRSLSALAGSATVPVAFLAGREALGRRAGVIAAALVAVNPMLIWYSQEARSYALLVFFGALALYCFLRALRSGGERGLAGWAIASVAALCSHYFAGFAIVIEAVWLLTALPARRRAVAVAVAAPVLTGIALLPLLLAQINGTHLGWISSMPLSGRLLETGVSFLAGETGNVIGEAARAGYAAVPALLIAAAVAVLLRRVAPHERRRVLPPLAVGLGVVVLATFAALAGKDYAIERNLLPALVPLLVVVAVAFAAARAGSLGVALAAVLGAYWLAFAIYVPLTPNLQRPDFRGVVEAAGPARGGPREIVGWTLGATALRHYLPDRSERVFGRLAVSEIDVAGKFGGRRLAAAMPAGFHLVGRSTAGTMTVSRFRSGSVRIVPYYRLRRLPTGYGSNGVVADGLGRSPGASGG